MHCITGTQCNPGKGKPADARNKTRLCQTISLYKLLCNPWILRVWGSIYTECVKAAVYGWKNQLYKYSLLLNHNGSNWYKRKFWIAKAEHWFFFFVWTPSQVLHIVRQKLLVKFYHKFLMKPERLNKRPKGHIAHLQLTQVAEQNSPLQPMVALFLPQGLHLV